MSILAVSIIVGILVLTIIIVVILKGRKSKAKDENITPKKSQVQKSILSPDENLFPGQNFIKPATFDVGLIKKGDIDSTPVYKSSNVCNDKVLWPFHQIYVDYGTTASDCPCTQFLQAP